MRYLIVTNNSKCRDRYCDRYAMDYREDWTYLDVLIHCRDLVHRGEQLITHPMAGSLKPNQTPYRSVILADETTEDKEPWRDVELMENSVAACEKFLRCCALPKWSSVSRADFKTLDLSFLEGALSQARTWGHSCGIAVLPEPTLERLGEV